MDADTPKISACPLAGWLRDRGIRLEPPSIRASRYGDWAPNTAYARGVHGNRSSEAPHLSKRWVYHPEPSRALRSTGQRRLCEVCLPGLPASHATQHPLSVTAPSRDLHTMEHREDG